MLHPKGASCGARCTIIFVHFSKTPHFQRHKLTSNQAKYDDQRPPAKKNQQLLRARKIAIRTNLIPPGLI
jgi:hypothetical protein